MIWSNFLWNIHLRMRFEKVLNLFGSIFGIKTFEVIKSILSRLEKYRKKVKPSIRPIWRGVNGIFCLGPHNFYMGPSKMWKKEREKLIISDHSSSIFKNPLKYLKNILKNYFAFRPNQFRGRSSICKRFVGDLEEILMLYIYIGIFYSSTAPKYTFCAPLCLSASNPRSVTAIYTHY